MFREFARIWWMVWDSMLFIAGCSERGSERVMQWERDAERKESRRWRSPSATVHHHCAYESCSVAQYLLTAQLLNTCSLADANNQLKANANEMNSMRSQLKLALGELAGQEGGDAGHKVRHTDWVIWPMNKTHRVWHTEWDTPSDVTNEGKRLSETDGGHKDCRLQIWVRCVLWDIAADVCALVTLLPPELVLSLTVHLLYLLLPEFTTSAADHCHTEWDRLSGMDYWVIDLWVDNGCVLGVACLSRARSHRDVHSQQVQGRGRALWSAYLRASYE